MTEESHRLWDLIVKACAALAFIAPLAIGYFQALSTADLEARKPYIHKQLDLCVSVTDAAGTIATAPLPADVAAATATLDRLFWGSLAIFDNEPVFKAVRDFQKAAEQKSGSNLRPLAENIAHRCKELTKASWKIR